MLNKTVGPYKISSQLHTLYTAAHVRTKAPVLIKSVVKTESAKAKLGLIKSVRCENVLSLIDVIEEESLYLVYEYCADSLVEYVKRKGRLEEDEVRMCMRQVIEACEEFISREIDHLHLRPEDIFITYKSDGEMVLKVGDVGVEVADGRLSDTWSFGLLMYYMLHGSLGRGQLKEFPQDVDPDESQYDVRADLGVCCVHLLSSCLQDDVKDRLEFSEVKSHPFFQETPYGSSIWDNHEARYLTKESEEELRLTVLTRYDHLIERENEDNGYKSKYTLRGDYPVENAEEDFTCSCAQSKAAIPHSGQSLCVECAANKRRSTVLHRLTEGPEHSSAFKLSSRLPYL